MGYLHNVVEELKSGLQRTNPESSRVEDLNQGPPDFKSSTLNHSATLPLNFRFEAHCSYYLSTLLYSGLMVRAFASRLRGPGSNASQGH